MNRLKYALLCASVLLATSCSNTKENLAVTVFETSAEGNKLTEITSFSEGEASDSIRLFPDKKYQTIIGIGASFTESSAYLLNQMSQENRDQIIRAYFAPEGSNYSLTRTHINSCDFSLGSYSYAPVAGDTELQHFSIEEDRDDIIPMIKKAMAVSKNGFKILASPWTAPPWMKDNQDWKAGKLLPEYRATWALFFLKYLEAYRNEGIDIWGITIENEPLGNDGNWESMHFTAEETVEFINAFLAPTLKKDMPGVKILAYDQNRGDELKEWAEVLYKDEESRKNIDGIAVHWYESTIDWLPENLEFVHDIAPEKILIHSEGCIDAEVPHWKDDQWYWEKEATDWGWDWASAEKRHLHPKYVPVYRYARDIIGCLNSWVEGWIDWNMVLDRQGGPNSAQNWGVAPVIVDPELDEVYYTPLYYTLAHFSKFIRPGAIRIGLELSSNDLMATAALNTDGSIALLVLNMNEEAKNIHISLGEQSVNISISARALQTIVL